MINTVPISQQIAAAFDQVLEGIANPKIKVTYAGELMSLIQHNNADQMEFIKTNYTASGVEATIRDRYDSQLYTITIAAKKKE